MLSSMYVWGMVRCAVGGDVKQVISNGWDARDPGDSRQCLNTGARLSSHVLSVRPSAAVVVVLVEASGHVTDGVQQHSTHSTHSRAHSTTGQARPVK